MATLLAESGSTKTDWVVIDGPQQGLSFQTIGLNPSYISAEQMLQILIDQFPSGVEEVRGVHFYGAGCSAPAPKMRVKQVLEHFFFQTTAHVEHDLLAAARGLLGKEPGLVCILGTGSHACRYDGADIAAEAMNLGYLLGDEGSGSHLGKALIQDFFYGQMPDAAMLAFAEAFDLDRDAVIDHLYRRASPNRYLAGFARFLATCPDRDYAEGILDASFETFLNMHLLPLYREVPGPISFTGSIAFHYQAALERVLNKAGLPAPTVAKSPLEGLVRYHRGEV